ncbi:MAG: hypothetical protein WAU88_09255, partial [Candidatus Zixiibacteriota bacterium]
VAVGLFDSGESGLFFDQFNCVTKEELAEPFGLVGRFPPQIDQVGMDVGVLHRARVRDSRSGFN